MWDELQSPENTEQTYKNVPYLLESNSKVNAKIRAFMDTMLSEVEKRQFEASLQNILNVMNNIKGIWERDYAWITISIIMDENIQFLISADILRVIFDNLILNSIQQNENINHLNITVTVKEMNDLLHFTYTDDGKGLDKKYTSNPRKILEVHETTRKNGHGLGMWIVINTIVMSEGKIIQDRGQLGFLIEFSVGGKM